MDELLSYTLLNFIVIIYISVFDIYIHAYAYMTDDVVTAGGSSSHDDGFNSLGYRTKEPPDPQATSQRNKSMRPREIRDMGKEKLYSRALVERDAKIGSTTHRGIFRIINWSHIVTLQWSGLWDVVSLQTLLRDRRKWVMK